MRIKTTATNAWTRFKEDYSWLHGRLAEPSTWAGLSAATAPFVQYHQWLLTISAASAMLAFAVKEKRDHPVRPA